MKNDIEYCPKCGRVVGKHQPSAALGAAREILCAPLDTKGNTVIDFAAIDKRTPPKGDRCYWCGTEVETTAKLFELSPEKRAKYEATANKRLLALARLGSYICRVDGGSPAKSRLYNYAIFKLSNRNADKAREINSSLVNYNAKMPYEQLKSDIAPALISPKTLCFAWRLIREDGIFTPNEDLIFTKLTKEFGLNNSQIEMIKQYTEDTSGMSEIESYESYFDLKPTKTSGARTDWRTFERLDNCDSPTYQEIQDGDTTRLTVLSEVNSDNSEILGIYTRTGEKLLVYSISSSAKRYDVIPGTKVISNQAFVDSSLKEIFIPDSVELIGKTAFKGCSQLSAIYTPADNKQKLRTLISRDLWPLVKEGRLKTLPIALCMMAHDCMQFAATAEGVILPADDDFSLKDCVLPPFITELGEGSFCNLPSLESIALPASLVKVDSKSLVNCVNLKFIYVPVGHAKRISGILPSRLAGLIKEDPALPKRAIKFGYILNTPPVPSRNTTAQSSNNAPKEDPAEIREQGLKYEKGDGVPKDINKANELYRRAADLGDATAMRYLAMNYGDGLGLQKDEYKANELFLKAAQAGNVEAMFHMAMGYLSGGAGIKRDFGQYDYWLKKAADGGHEVAKELLGKREEYEGETPCSIVLLDVGSHKLAVMKVMHDYCNMSLAEAKNKADYVEKSSKPTFVVTSGMNIPRSKGKIIKKEFEAAGATVILM